MTRLRTLTHEVYLEEAIDLADKTFNRVAEMLGRGQAAAASAALLDYQQRRDALWQARLAQAALETQP
jgi:hypothetical protein